MMTGINGLAQSSFRMAGNKPARLSTKAQGRDDQMANDVIKLNSIVTDIGNSMAALMAFGRNGLTMPKETTPEELEAMVGLPMGPWRPLSSDLVWFHALKATVLARQMLEECHRIFKQVGDDQSTQKVQAVINTVDAQFHPGETAMQIYVRLLNSNANQPLNDAHGL